MNVRAMLLSSTYLRRLAAVALAAIAPSAMAGYYQWETVELPVGASACGNGTPYRFFVNRTPLNKNLAIVFEGGGACWDQNACLGKGKLGASNPDGIPPDYIRTGVLNGLVTPFSSRNDPFQAVQTQDWNIVFLPYCTGDVHGGNKMSIYDDVDPANPRVQHHAGKANVRGAAQWLRATLGQPDKLMLTGYSAGGVGSTIMYGVVRDTLEPTGHATLLADSGPLMTAPRSEARGGNVPPSLPLHDTIRTAWGLDEPGGLITMYRNHLPGFDPEDLGSVNRALAAYYPNDRFGFMVFNADMNFSAFSYEKFYDDIANAPTPQAYREALFARWVPDVARWRDGLAQSPNVSFHIPYFRNFNDSHCLSVIDFSGTGIEAAGVPSLAPFIDANLDRGPLMRNAEANNAADLTQELSPIIKLYKLLTRFLAGG